MAPMLKSRLHRACLSLQWSACSRGAQFQTETLLFPRGDDWHRRRPRNTARRGWLSSTPATHQIPPAAQRRNVRFTLMVDEPAATRLTQHGRSCCAVADMWPESGSASAHRKSAKSTQQLPIGFSGVVLIGTQRHTRAICALQERQNSSRRGAKAHDLKSCDDEPAVKALQRVGWCRESRFES